MQMSKGAIKIVFQWFCRSIALPLRAHFDRTCTLTFSFQNYCCWNVAKLWEFRISIIEAQSPRIGGALKIRKYFQVRSENNPWTFEFINADAKTKLDSSLALISNGSTAYMVIPSGKGSCEDFGRCQVLSSLCKAGQYEKVISVVEEFVSAQLHQNVRNEFFSQR